MSVRIKNRLQVNRDSSAARTFFESLFPDATEPQRPLKSGSGNAALLSSLSVNVKQRSVKRQDKRHRLQVLTPKLELKNKGCLGVPTILSEKNTLLAAETGCGKTLAYLLPVIQQILSLQHQVPEDKLNSPLALVVTPNRELATQIGVITGGRTKRTMMNPSFEKIDLLIATLGTLSKLTTTGIYNMSRVRHIILDEADTLLDDSFNEKLCHFLRRFTFHHIPGVIADNDNSKRVQLSLISATMPTSLPEILGEVVAMDSLVKVTTSHLHMLLPHVPQKFLRLGRTQKPEQLLKLVKADSANKEPVIVFSNKATTCDWVSMFLNENGVKCVNFNGEMAYVLRQGKFKQFQDGEVNVIACTDIGSRGLNTIRVKHVINYDFPLYMADYIHRCGRTGRVGSSKDGHVTNFVAGDLEVNLVQEIEWHQPLESLVKEQCGQVTQPFVDPIHELLIGLETLGTQPDLHLSGEMVVVCCQVRALRGMVRNLSVQLFE
uniref:RNA helicase n=1 Tax=Timema douglasi TaxID=61478 RepID=A0A7R8ZCI8_TIMDO|nr:unnamed protein product [Timema douglasi]